jgi:S1-C subfamily serine protease
VVVLVGAAAVLLGCGYFAVAGDWVPGGEPRRVFKRISPSIVLIRGEVSYGSGVVVSADGLVVTNRHVIEAEGKLTVAAVVVEKGRRIERTFESAEVVGLHPRYDAALVRIRAPGRAFVPARLGDSRYGVHTGDICYVIGNPGAYRTNAMRNTITPGIVSAAKRRVEGLDYVQTSAAVNGGNSGGALCDTSGNVIGIVTYKPYGTEGIGLAIPISNLRWREFYRPTKATLAQEKWP